MLIVFYKKRGVSRYHLDQVGLSILLQKVMNEKKEELTLFPFYANKPGFINKVSEMIAEFKNYCVSPSQLFQCVNESTEAMNWSIQSSKKLMTWLFYTIRLRKFHSINI